MCRCLHRKSAYPVGCGSPWPPVRVALPRTLRGPSSRPVCGPSRPVAPALCASCCTTWVRPHLCPAGALVTPRGPVTGVVRAIRFGHAAQAGAAVSPCRGGKQRRSGRPAVPGPGAVARRGRGACTVGCRLPTQQSARPGVEHPLPARGEGLTPSRVRAPPAPRRRPRPRGLTTAATDRPPADCRPRARPSARGPSPQARKPAAAMRNHRQADRRCQTHAQPGPAPPNTPARADHRRGGVSAGRLPTMRTAQRPGPPLATGEKNHRDGPPARRLPASWATRCSSGTQGRPSPQATKPAASVRNRRQAARRCQTHAQPGPAPPNTAPPTTAPPRPGGTDVRARATAAPRPPGPAAARRTPCRRRTA